MEDIEGKRREIVEELAQIRRETRVRNSCFSLLHSPLSSSVECGAVFMT